MVQLATGTNTQELERRLWEAADELRANSKLKSSEYAMPVLGLIFLRLAGGQFAAQVAHGNHSNPERQVSGTRAGLSWSARRGETR